MLTAASRSLRAAATARLPRAARLISGRLALACAMLAGSHVSLAQTDAGAINTSLMTVNNASGVSGGQSVRPLASQRASAIGFGGGEVDAEPAGVDIFLLTPRVSAVDMAFPTDGFGVTVGRSYNGAQAAVSTGYQGNNWFQSSRPELVRGTTSVANDTLYFVVGADRVMEFIRVGTSSTVFVGVNGTLAIVKATPDASANPGTIEIRDLSGNVWTFFDFDGNAQGAEGQLWKVASADGTGTTAYVGTDSSLASALAAFEFDGGTRTARVTKFVDGSDRLFEYSYTTTAVGASKRLLSVVAKTKTGGTWASPTGVVEVGRVEYQYYGEPGAPTDTNGSTGDLRLVTVTTPLTGNGSSVPAAPSAPTSTVLAKSTYYRYTTTAPLSRVRIVVGPEGCRDIGVANLATTSDADLLLRSSHEFTYSTVSGKEKQVATARVNAGGCGSCGGAPATSPHSLVSETNGSFAGTSGYDGSGDWGSTMWERRTIITRPDNAKVAIYFDETGQQLGRVLSSSSTFASSNWATKIERDGSGRLIKQFATSAVSAYNHTTGAITLGSSGLTHFRNWSSDTKLPYATVSGWVGNAPGATWSGSEWSSSTQLSASVNVAQSITLTDGTNTARLSTNTPSSSSSYPDGSADTTNVSRTFWSGANAWATKQTIVTAPSISHSYSPASVTSETYTDAKRRTVLSKDPVGKWTFTKYDANGQVVKRVEDAKSGSGSDADATAAATTYSVTLPASGFNLVTLYSYDAQGRMTESTAPDGRMSRMHYTKLASGLPVTLSVGSVSGSTHNGPVSYTVSNLAGQTVASGTIALPSGSTTTAMSGWINSASSDIIGAISVGTLSSLTVNVYDASGVRRTESRAFFSIPSTYAAATSTSNFDPTIYTYDSSGRTLTVTDPTDTITKSIYDSIGRLVTTQIGVGANLYDVQTIVYDSGGVGNGYVTSRTAKVDSNTANDRTSTTLYDYRGRAIVQLNPIAPHSVMKYDNLGRTLAVGTYSSSSGLTASTDPTTTTTNRVALSETTFDDRGRGYQQTRHNINQTNGASADTLVTHTWVDAAGRTIKSNAGTLSKTFYDTLGRPTHRFVLAKDNDSSFADAGTVAGDYVMEEHQTLYNATDGTMEMSVAILRHPKDTTTTGALDAVGDAIGTVAVGNASMKGRVSITSMYYDLLDRAIATVQLGTNGGSTYTRSSDTSVGTRSAARLISETVYMANGRVDSTVDPKGVIAKTQYDALGQVTRTIQNYVDGTPGGGGTLNDEDLVSSNQYSRGQLTKSAADFGTLGDFAGTDQVTTYTYGVDVASGSAIASNRLLESYTTPEGRTTSRDYNRLGQLIYTKDQPGNIVEYDYDTLGREVARRASAATGFSSDILRIATTYLARGARDTVTQYDAATGGTAKDQVQFDYDGWGNVITIEQDVDGVISTTGIDPWTVSTTYAKAAASGTAQTLRIIEQSSPWFDGSNKVSYSYGSAGSIADWSSRVHAVDAGTTTIAQYDYLGTAHVVGTELSQASVEIKHFTYSGSTHSYDQLDNFGRARTSDWYRMGVTARDHALVANSLSYDERGSVTVVSDEVHGLDVSGTFTSTHDTVYTHDDLGRLVKAESGALNTGGTAIVSGSVKRSEEWSLDVMGNWLRDKLDLNGDADFADAGERDLTNEFNKQNEYTKRGVFKKTNVAYNTNGLVKTAILEGSPVEQGYQYDAFGRMTGYFTNINTLTGQLAKYRYNGLGQRIMWQYDVNSNGTLAADEQYFFVHDAKGRVVASMRHTGTGDVVTMQEAFVYHAAGLAGRGGSSLRESAIVRDVDSDYKWATASDDVLNVRTFYVQNWKGDVMAVLDAEGRPLERVRYTAFGTPSAHPIADVDGNGVVNAADLSAFLTFQAGGANGTVFATTDLNADGLFPDDEDIEFFDDEYVRVGAGSVFGMNRVSGVGSREGFGGSDWDPPTRGWVTRTTVLESESGRSVGADSAMFANWIEDTHLPNYWKEPEPGSVSSTNRQKCEQQKASAMADPAVVEALANAQATCPNTPLPSIRLTRCGDENLRGEFSCSLFGGSSISVCYNQKWWEGDTSLRCPTRGEMIKVIIHELTHFKQFCRRNGGSGGFDGGSYGGDCIHFQIRNPIEKTYDEIEGYCSEGGVYSCPPSDEYMARGLCRVVEASGGMYCLCMRLVGYPECDEPITPGDESQSKAISHLHTAM